LPGTALEAQAAGLTCLLSDTITPEARVVDDLVSFLPIGEGTKPWLEEIVRVAEKPCDRRDTVDEVRQAGYDIEEVARWYEALYTEALPEKQI